MSETRPRPRPRSCRSGPRAHRASGGLRAHAVVEQRAERLAARRRPGGEVHERPDLVARRRVHGRAALQEEPRAGGVRVEDGPVQGRPPELARQTVAAAAAGGVETGWPQAGSVAVGVPGSVWRPRNRQSRALCFQAAPPHHVRNVRACAGLEEKLDAVGPAVPRRDVERRVVPLGTKGSVERAAARRGETAGENGRRFSYQQPEQCDVGELSGR